MTTELRIRGVYVVFKFQWIPERVAIQNFAFSSIDNSYSYTTQRKGNNTILIKYHRSYDVVSSNGVWQQDLTNYGHGETLECTPSTVASKEFIWVGCEANTAVTNCWSTRIARLYVLHNGDGFAIEKVKILKNFKYATADGRALNSGTVKRLIATIDETYSRICFRIHFPGNDSGDSVYYAIYDLAKINKLLNKAETTVSMKDAKDAYIMGFKAESTKLFQGMALRGNNKLYISSGDLNDSIPNMIKEYTYNRNGMTLNREFNVELDNSVSNVVGDKSLSSAEIEGIKVYNSSVYMTLNFMKNAAGVDLKDHANGTPLIARSIPD